MPQRQFYYDESVGSTNTTSATYQTKCSITFTPDASSDYLIMASGLIQNATNATSDSKMRIQDTTNTITYSEQNLEMKEQATAPIDWWMAGGMAAFTSGGSPSSTTIELQFAAETGGDTINCKEGRLCILKLTTDDKWTYSAANFDSTSGSMTTATGSLTFTPATTGDYLIIAFGEISNNSAAGDNYAMQLLDSGSVARGLKSTWLYKDGTNFIGWGTAIRQNLTNSSKTFAIQQQNVPNAGDTIRSRNRCIVALRLDGFTNNYYNESRTRSTSTSTSYQNGAQLTQAPIAVYHLIVAVGMHDSNSASVSSYMQLDQDATGKTEKLIEFPTTNSYCAWWHFEIQNMTGASTTLTVQAKSETTGATTGRSETAISLIQLDNTPLAPIPENYFYRQTRLRM